MTLTRLLLPFCVLLFVPSLRPALRPKTPSSEDAGGVTTLYARDDLRSSIDFRSGGPGGAVRNGEVRLEDAQLAYGAFVSSLMSFGFVRDERVAVLDLGEVVVHPRASVRDRAAEFPISVFHTLFLEGAHFGFIGPDDDVRTLAGAEHLLSGIPSEGPHHLQPELGHVYVLRSRRKGAGSADQFFKFQVIDLVPEQRLTIRWDALPVR